MIHDLPTWPTTKIVRRDTGSTSQDYAAFVRDERDLVGLVAFALHEGQAREWRNEMERLCGRPPTEGEVNAYRLGETTPNRILAYRFLAAESLAGCPAEKPRPAFSSDPAFVLFCASEYDFVGMVAFAIHEQQARQWREAMRAACGRNPTADEERAHGVSETSPRRIQAYRHLAAERLAGRGPELTAGAAKVSFILRALGRSARSGLRRPGRWRLPGLSRA